MTKDFENPKNILDNVFANLIKNGEDDLKIQLESENFLSNLKENENFAESVSVSFLSFGGDLFKNEKLDLTTDKKLESEIELSEIIEKLDGFNDLIENFSKISEELSNNKDFISDDGTNFPNVKKYADFSANFLKINAKNSETVAKNDRIEPNLEMEKLIGEELLEDLAEKIDGETDEEYDLATEKNIWENGQRNTCFDNNFQEKGNTGNESKQNDQEIRQTINSILNHSGKSEIESIDKEYQDLQKDYMEVSSAEKDKNIVEEAKFEGYFQVENENPISFSPKKVTEIYRESSEIMLEEKIADQIKTNLAKVSPIENKFIVQLEPRGLGSLYIEVNFENDAVESIMIEAATHRTFELLHGEMADLKNSLSDLGFQIPEKKLNLMLNDGGGNGQNHPRKNKEEKLVENLRDVTEKIERFIQYYPGEERVRIIA